MKQEPTLTVVIQLYNEQDNVATLVDRVHEGLADPAAQDFVEIVCVGYCSQWPSLDQKFILFACCE